MSKEEEKWQPFELILSWVFFFFYSLSIVEAGEAAAPACGTFAV